MQELVEVLRPYYEAFYKYKSLVNSELSSSLLRQLCSFDSYGKVTEIFWFCVPMTLDPVIFT
jgi:hypothetical protein